MLGHLMRRAGVKHFYMHSITGIDPPELVYFQRDNFERYKADGYLTYDIMYSMSMIKLCQKKGILPMRQRRFCCEHLKERYTPEQGNAILSMGVRKAESSNRNAKRNELEIVTGKKNIIMPFDNSDNRRTFETCYRDNSRRVNPIAYWSNEDIWNYSNDVKLKQCCLYNEGHDRLGCIGCPNATEQCRKREFVRWPKFKAYYILIAEKIIETRKLKGQKLFINSPEKYFDWWVSDRAQEKTDEDQLDFWEFAY